MEMELSKPFTGIVTFNRTIVELKYIQVVKCLWSRYTFNRTIVELK